jgi:hypothetical protein
MNLGTSHPAPAPGAGRSKLLAVKESSAWIWRIAASISGLFFSRATGRIGNVAEFGALPF